MVLGESSINYTIEGVIWGHDLLRSCRQGLLGWPAIMLKSAETCLPILRMLS